MSAAPELPAPGAASPVRVRVPCSTSNLGAGFDCVGVALDLWLDAEAWREGDDATPRLARGGTLRALGDAPAGGDLLVRGVALACAAAGRALPTGLALRATSEIPVARGLGSSAAALVAGALLADTLLALGLGARRVAALCATEEGHPDNVAPMVLGGAVLGVPAVDGHDGGHDDGHRDVHAAGGSDGWAFATLDVHPDVAFALAVPTFGTETRAMRDALPAALSHRDGVRAAGKSAALVRGLALADPALLAWALDDVLHVPYRRTLVPGYDAVCAAARGAGAWGATLSGAGSSLLALASRAAAPTVAAAMCAAWRAHDVDASPMVPAIVAEGARRVA